MSAAAKNLSLGESGIFRSEADKELRELMDKTLRSGTNQAHYFLNERRLLEQLSVFQKHFLPGDSRRRILYAMKANPREEIMRILANGKIDGTDDDDFHGVDGFDCASWDEIRQVIYTPGQTAQKAYYNNPAKTAEEMEMALSHGVQYFTVHSDDSLEVVRDAQSSHQRPDLEVAVRVGLDNPDADIKLPDKYGCNPEDAVRLLGIIQENRMKASLAMNVGSQNRNPQAIINGIKLLRDIAKEVGGVHSVNFGGGIPLNYFPDDNHDIPHFLSVMSGAAGHYAREIFGKRAGEDGRFYLEPGRALVGPAVDLAVPITDISRYSEHDLRRLHIGDGATISFSDAKLHPGWRYNLRAFTHDRRLLTGLAEDFVVWGRTCDSGDSLGIYTFPSDIRRRDFLWERKAGAYHDSQASRHCGFRSPKYISYNRVEE